jgi:GTP-binding protein Era
MEEAKLAIPDADSILFVVDGQEMPGNGDKWIIQNILQEDKPVILVINKIDLVKDSEKKERIIEAYKKLFEDKKISTLQLSAKTGKNCENLLKNLFRSLPKGPQYFPDDEVTDQTMRVIASEIIREKLLHNTTEELPHSIAVQINLFKNEEDITKIEATIFIERDSQKGMIIGKNGAMLKKIGSLARKDLEEMIEQKVYLGLSVKVKKNWRKNPSALKKLGYDQKPKKR